MPDLACALLRVVGRPDDEYATFLSDFTSSCLKAGNGVFPPDLAKAACEMRVLRLLAEPLEVDGVVFSLRSLPVRRLRQKSKQLVAKPGHLEASASVATLAAPPSAPAQAFALQAPQPAIPAPDLAALEDRIAKRVLEAVEMMYGAGSSAPATATLSDDQVSQLKKRIGLGEINVVNLADAVRLVCPALVYKAHPTIIKEGDE